MIRALLQVCKAGRIISDSLHAQNTFPQCFYYESSSVNKIVKNYQDLIDSILDLIVSIRMLCLLKLGRRKSTLVMIDFIADNADIDISCNIFIADL